MTKHIAGLILFTLIVGTSVVIADLFYETPRTVKSFTVRGDYRSYQKKHRKHRRPRVFRNRLVSTGLTLAVFDTNTGRLTTLHDAEVAAYSRNRRILVYHFYLQDEFGARHVRSERIWRTHKLPEVTTMLRWLEGRHSKENLYVISEYRNHRHTINNAPKFDPSKAVPVLIKDAYQ